MKVWGGRYFDLFNRIIEIQKYRCEKTVADLKHRCEKTDADLEQRKADKYSLKSAEKELSYWVSFVKYFNPRKYCFFILNHESAFRNNIFIAESVEGTEGQSEPNNLFDIKTDDDLGYIVEVTTYDPSLGGGSHKTKIQFTRKYKRRTSRKNKSYKVRRT